MICPACHGSACFRSRTRTILDRLLRYLLFLRPWRCRSCDQRFYAWVVPASFSWRAHCQRCGNLDLERIPGRKVERDPLRLPKRLLGFAAYRCAPCRERFFSLRLYRPLEPASQAELARHPQSD